MLEYKFRLRNYYGTAGKKDVGLRPPKLSFLDGYENPNPIHNYDPRPMSQRIRSEILKLESKGDTARRKSFVVKPDTGIWRKMGNKTFYHLFGLRHPVYEPKKDWLSKALQSTHSILYFLDGTYKINSTANYFSGTTTNKWYMGIKMEGETASGQLNTNRGDVLGVGAGTRGAYFVWTGTAGGTMIQTSPNNKYPLTQAGFVFGQHVENLGFDPGGSAPGTGQAGIGLDLTSQETGIKTLVRNIWAGRYTTNTTGVGNWFSTVGVVLDGTEDGFVDEMFTGGTGAGTSTTGNTIDLSWDSIGGDVKVENCQMAGAVSLLISTQLGVIDHCTVGPIKFGRNASSSGGTYSVIQSYLANNRITGYFLLNSVSIKNLSVKHCFLFTFATVPIFLGPGTITNSSWSGNFINDNGVVSWSSGAPTLSKQVSLGDNASTKISGTPFMTGAPFNSDANGNW